MAPRRFNLKKLGRGRKVVEDVAIESDSEIEAGPSNYQGRRNYGEPGVPDDAPQGSLISRVFHRQQHANPPHDSPNPPSQALPPPPLTQHHESQIHHGQPHIQAPPAANVLEDADASPPASLLVEMNSSPGSPRPGPQRGWRARMAHWFAGRRRGTRRPRRASSPPPSSPAPPSLRPSSTALQFYIPPPVRASRGARDPDLPAPSAPIDIPGRVTPSGDVPMLAGARFALEGRPEQRGVIYAGPDEVVRPLPFYQAQHLLRMEDPNEVNYFANSKVWPATKETEGAEVIEGFSVGEPSGSRAAEQQQQQQQEPEQSGRRFGDWAVGSSEQRRFVDMTTGRHVGDRWETRWPAFWEDPFYQEMFQPRKRNDEEEKKEEEEEDKPKYEGKGKGRAED
ncbi:unnamed protein product [Periconia digitata]|uniref:Uncharacterized protein n=1 Tax=Periconia digitata TaxID=1303443 RepID=A0A9W4UV99_9PLEO|nr:unnamed protein product [Periconia digitata]